MATGGRLNQCSTCKIGGGHCICGGCKAAFCKKHFEEHGHQLSVEFDQKVVGAHDELLQQINQVKQSKNFYVDLFRQINRWEKATIEKVNNAAGKARQQVDVFINRETKSLTEQFETLTKEIRRRQVEDDFVEDDIKQLQANISQLRQLIEKLMRSDNVQLVVVEKDESYWNGLIYAKKPASQHVPDIPVNANWTQNGITVAGGNKHGNELNQFHNPVGLYVDDDQTVYIADCNNHRIVEWKRDATIGKVVAGGNGPGNQTDQLSAPTDVILDRKTDSFIICDRDNRRVVSWPRRGGTSGQTIISNVACRRLAMDDNGFLYVSDDEKHEVRRWRVGETSGVVVAGGNGQGDRLDQLNTPRSIFVDQNYSVYVSDTHNHRVMKWVKGAKEGIIVAGGQGQGSLLTQLNMPQGVVVDQLGTVYVVDNENGRIMCWSTGAIQGSIVVGGNGKGGLANELNAPMGLSFDQYGDLYVADQSNHRVQRFSINRDTRP